MNCSGQTDIFDDLKTAFISVHVQGEVILAEFYLLAEFFEARCVRDVTHYITRLGPQCKPFCETVF